jgi:hypothetical protein
MLKTEIMYLGGFPKMRKQRKNEGKGVSGVVHPIWLTPKYNEAATKTFKLCVE